jgi:sec-independent protein translocase protein TatC
VNLPSFDTYLSYFTGMVVGFGIVFELPLVIVMLNMAGILTHERFRKWRRMLIFGVFLLAGMVNPSPDPMTMLILGGVAVALVEIAEVFVYFNDKRRAARNPDPYAGLSDDELAPVETPEPVDADNSLN